MRDLEKPTESMVKIVRKACAWTLSLESLLGEDKVQSNEAVFEGSNATEFLAHTLHTSHGV